MDIATHALLGALSASLVSRHPNRRTCALAGGTAALAPDLDVLIRSAQDPLLVLEYHRHFSHSLLIAPVAAALLTLLLWPLLRRWLPPRPLFLCALAGYVSACLLDVCTSYGTYLFWPLIRAPFSLDIIAVVDPLFTLLVLVGLIVVLKKPYSPWRWCAPVTALVYLILGYMQLQRALDYGQHWAQENGVTPERLVAKPTLANLVLWRVLVVEESRIHALAFYLPPFAVRTYIGNSVERLDPQTWGALPPESRAYRDLQRFHGFADQLLVADPHNPARIGDARYAMLPNTLEPLWGIEIDAQYPDRTPEFFTQRDSGPEVRKRFIAMLLGRSLR
jgi:inner membrane protein